MTELTEKPVWGGVKQLSRLDKVEGGRQGAANLQAQQLVQRTAWLKEALESLSDYRQYTFYTSENDPDGTIAGLAGTPQGTVFRVAIPDTEGVTVAFSYYKNDGGIALYINSQPNSRYIENVIEYITQEVRNRTSLIFSTDTEALLSLCDEFGYEAAKITESGFETDKLKIIRTGDNSLLSLVDEYGNGIDIFSENGNLVAGDNELTDSEHFLSFPDPHGNELVIVDKYGRQRIGDSIVIDAPEWAHVVLDEFGWVVYGYKNDGTYVGPDTGSGGNVEPVPSVLETDSVAHWLFGYESTSLASRVGIKSFTPQSAPEFNQNYISLPAWGGALISDIPESGEYTVCSVVRIPAQGIQTDCVVIYGTQNGYAVREDDDSTFSGNQLSLFSDRTDRRWVRSKISGYRATSRRYPSSATPVGKWLFITHVVKLTGGGERYQVISISGDYQKLREADTDSLILSGRNFALGNAYCDIAMFKTRGLDVAECIYFDAALSATDIQRVYQNSRQRMAERSINLQ